MGQTKRNHDDDNDDDDDDNDEDDDEDDDRDEDKDDNDEDDDDEDDDDNDKDDDDDDDSNDKEDDDNDEGNNDNDENNDDNDDEDSNGNPFFFRLSCFFPFLLLSHCLPGPPAKDGDCCWDGLLLRRAAPTCTQLSFPRSFTAINSFSSSLSQERSKDSLLHLSLLSSLFLVSLPMDNNHLLGGND